MDKGIREKGKGRHRNKERVGKSGKVIKDKEMREGKVECA